MTRLEVYAWFLALYGIVTWNVYHKQIKTFTQYRRGRELFRQRPLSFPLVQFLYAASWPIHLIGFVLEWIKARNERIPYDE